MTILNKSVKKILIINKNILEFLMRGEMEKESYSKNR
jgi:hypothetical protein